MKKSKKKSIALIVSLLSILAILIGTLVFSVFASEEDDAMIDIETALSAYQVGEKVSFPDGYIGIPVEFTTYYNYNKFGAAKTDYYGTNIGVYFVNTAMERVGTETDVNIISELLDRGFAVVVADYKNDSKAKSPALDWSSQEVRKKVIDGSVFTDKTVFPSGTYRDTHVLPAGYSVMPFNKFWSLDEHGADGSLEKVVEIWNNDFRGYKRDVIVNWTKTETDAEGNEVTVQKATQSGFDGSAPQWYSDAAGKNPVDASSADAKYIKIMHTQALTITDCTAKDGTPISLDAKMHITYPVKPESDVPVMILSGSSEYLTTGKTGDDTRPQLNGYLFRGYAGAIFDHMYTPMAFSNYYGYFDGSNSKSVTGDHTTYSMHLTYNSARIDTAAVRYVRYLAYTEPDKFSFDTEHIGMFGNSKGGLFMFMGSAELREYTEIKYGMTLAESIDARINSYANRMFPEHHGETRYQNGITEDYTVGDYTIRGGKLQPWLTYNDKDGVEREILAYTSLIYPGNGGNVHLIKEGHAPIFNILCINDPLGNGYGSSAEMVAATKMLNVPSVSFVTSLAHSLANGLDSYHNVDTYDALFAFSNYYLKGAAVEVLYTEPAIGFADMDTTEPIIIKFSGAVAESEITKITLTDSNGKIIDGVWESAFGNTEWTFVHEVLLGNEEYTLTVPAGIAGENGAPTSEAFFATYRTRNESSTAPTVIKTENATYVTVSKQDLSSASGAKLRFLVENDAANIASVHEVAIFNSESPDSSVLGNKIGELCLYGSGYYELDVSDSISALADGESRTFVIKTDKPIGVYDVSSQNFYTSASNLGKGTYTVAELDTVPDGKGTTAAKIFLTTNPGAHTNSVYYPSTATILSNSKIFSKTTVSDLGRKYTVTLKVFDTVTRTISLKFNNATNGNAGILDFDYAYYNTTTKANEWTDITFDYTVLDPLYGTAGLYTKKLNVTLATDGSLQSPIYLGELIATETVTGADITEVHVALYDDGTVYKAPVSEKPFSIGDTDYDTLAAALSSAKSGDTVIANSNYTVTESFSGLESLESVTLDLSGYKLYLEGSTPLFTAKATSVTVAKSTATVKGGAIYIGDSPVVTYSGSTSAGSGKSFVFTFENVSFIATDLAMAKKLISDSTVSSASSLAADFSFTSCEFRIEKDKLTKNPVTLLPLGEGALELNFTLAGGKIALDTMINVTLFDSYKNVTVAGENSPVITLPVCKTFAETFVKSETAICSFVLSEQTEGMATYAIKVNENATPYGIIPESSADAEKYPFVVFDRDGNFLGAYSKFLGSNGNGGALERPRTFLEKNGYNNGAFDDPDATVYVVARRDYVLESNEVFNNLAQYQGNVIVDLGNHTLSQGECSSAFFKAASKGWSSAAGEKIFPVTVKVKNGKLLVTKSGAISMDTWDSLGDCSVQNKEISLTFDNVTFGFAEGATTSTLLTSYNKPNSTSVAAKFKVILNDCVFDYATVAPASATTLFDTNTAGKFIDVDYTVNGGKILGGAFTNVTVANKTGSYTSSVVFGKGSDGEYTKLIVNKDASVNVDSYTLDNGSGRAFVYNSTSDDGDVYVLEKSDLITPYGTIPADYADAETYPFVIFDGKGNFLKAYKYWLGNNNGVFDYIAYTHHKYNAWNATTGKYTNNGGAANTSIVYLRRNYDMNSSDVKFHNTGAIQGEVLIDLGGHTLSQGTSSARVLPLHSKGWSGAAGEKVFPTTLNFINGKILTKGSSVMSFEVWDSVGGGAIANKRFEVSFTNVTFGLSSGSSLGNYMINYSHSTTSVAAPFYLSYNDCIFDFETNKSSSAMTLFGSWSDTHYAKSTISINGGLIKLGSATNITIAKTDGAYGSTITFAKYNGEYTALTFSGSTVTAEAINTDAGEMKFVKVSDGNYTLGSVKNPYGSDIPQNYGYAEAYPLVVLDQDGKFIAAYNKLNGSNNGALSKIAYTHLTKNGWDEANQKWTGTTTGIIMLLRRDYVLGTEEYFNNLGHVQGTIIFDLCGHSITQQSGSKDYSLFNLNSKGWSSAAGAKVFPTTLTVKNGSINMYANTVVGMACWDSIGGGTIAKKKFTVNFDGVKFGLTKGATLTNLLITTGKQTDTPGADAPFFITFNDCEYDLVTNSNGKTVTLFNNNASAAKYVSCNLKINGGTVKANNASLVKFWTLDTTGTSTVAFGCGSNGYLKLELPSGKLAPASAFPTANGDYVFVKTADDGDFVTYTLGQESLTDIKPKVSITLYSDFVYNIYIPKTAMITKVMLGGEEITLSDYEIVTVDGADYYKVTKTFAAKEAAGEFELLISVTLNDGRVGTSKWTLGIIKYLENLLGDNTVSAEEKTLVQDILAYIKAAYTYFKVDGADAVGNKIDSILGDYEREALDLGTAVNTTEGLSDVTVVLGAEVAFKFIPEDPSDADKFVFTQNGRALKSEVVTTDTETYILVTTFAYGITDTVSYTAKVSDTVTYTGSFNLKAYYDYVSGEGMSDVVAILDALWQYSKSAESYRASVTK